MSPCTICDVVCTLPIRAFGVVTVRRMTHCLNDDINIVRHLTNVVIVFNDDRFIVQTMYQIMNSSILKIKHFEIEKYL